MSSDEGEEVQDVSTGSFTRGRQCHGRVLSRLATQLDRLRETVQTKTGKPKEMIEKRIEYLHYVVTMGFYPAGVKMPRMPAKPRKSEPASSRSLLDEYKRALDKASAAKAKFEAAMEKGKGDGFDCDEYAEVTAREIELMEELDKLRAQRAKKRRRTGNAGGAAASKCQAQDSASDSSGEDASDTDAARHKRSRARAKPVGDGGAARDASGSDASEEASDGDADDDEVEDLTVSNDNVSPPRSAASSGSAASEHRERVLAARAASDEVSMPGGLSGSDENPLEGGSILRGPTPPTPRTPGRGGTSGDEALFDSGALPPTAPTPDCEGSWSGWIPLDEESTSAVPSGTECQDSVAAEGGAPDAAVPDVAVSPPERVVAGSAVLAVPAPEIPDSPRERVVAESAVSAVPAPEIPDSPRERVVAESAVSAVPAPEAVSDDDAIGRLLAHAERLEREEAQAVIEESRAARGRLRALLAQVASRLAT